MPESLIAPTGFNRLKQCKHGYMLYNIHDMYIGQSLDQYGEFTDLELDLIKQIIRPGDVVLDVGANIGTHTVAMANWVGPSGAVVSFEPQRIVFQTLCANVALNSLTNVHTIRAAAGATFGMIVVPPMNYEAANNFGALALGQYEEGEAVDQITIDSLNLPACRLIKLDIEGMESEALAGAVETLARHQPILYVENERPEKSDALIRQIDQLGYNLYWHIIPYYNPNNFFKNPNNIWQIGLHGRNMIGLPKTMTQSLSGFEPVKVPPA